MFAKTLKRDARPASKRRGRPPGTVGANKLDGVWYARIRAARLCHSDAARCVSSEYPAHERGAQVSRRDGQRARCNRRIVATAYRAQCKAKGTFTLYRGHFLDDSGP